MGKKRTAQNKPNPVAKFAGQFNRAAVFVDRKKAAKRGAFKHAKNRTHIYNDWLAA